MDLLDASVGALVHGTEDEMHQVSCWAQFDEVVVWNAGLILELNSKHLDISWGLWCMAQRLRCIPGELLGSVCCCGGMEFWFIEGI
jgi:hypothetical protein